MRILKIIMMLSLIIYIAQSNVASAGSTLATPSLVPADMYSLLALSELSEFRQWEEEVAMLEEKYKNIINVLPEFTTLIFDNDQFFTWPVIDLSQENLNEIIKGNKKMPVKYILSPHNYVLIKK